MTVYPAHFIAEGATTFTTGVDRWMGDAWVARVPEASGPIARHADRSPQPAHALLISTGPCHHALLGATAVLIIENLNGLEDVDVPAGAGSARPCC